MHPTLRSPTGSWSAPYPNHGTNPNNLYRERYARVRTPHLRSHHGITLGSHLARKRSWHACIEKTTTCRTLRCPLGASHWGTSKAYAVHVRWLRTGNRSNENPDMAPPSLPAYDHLASSFSRAPLFLRVQNSIQYSVPSNTLPLPSETLHPAGPAHLHRVWLLQR